MDCGLRENLQETFSIFLWNIGVSYFFWKQSIIDSYK